MSSHITDTDDQSTQNFVNFTPFNQQIQHDQQSFEDLHFCETAGKVPFYGSSRNASDAQQLFRDSSFGRADTAALLGQHSVVSACDHARGTTASQPRSQPGPSQQQQSQQSDRLALDNHLSPVYVGGHILLEGFETHHDNLPNIVSNALFPGQFQDQGSVSWDTRIAGGSASQLPFTQEGIAANPTFAPQNMGIPRHMASASNDQDSEASFNDDEEVKKQLELIAKAIKKVEIGIAEPCLITEPFTKHIRRLTHQIASSSSLSHVTIGNGPERRIIISKYNISPFDGPKPPYNPKSNVEHIPWLVLNGVTIDHIPTTIGERRIENFRVALCIPKPQKLVLSPPEPGQAYFSAYAEYDDVVDAAHMVRNMNGKRPVHSSNDCLQVGFRVSKIPVQLPSSTSVPNVANASMSGSKSPALRCATTTLDQVLSSFTTDDDDDVSILSPLMQGRPALAHRAQNISSGAETVEQCSNPGQPTHKRKRNDKIPKRYPCTAPDCSKVFDRSCDRDDHAKSHTPWEEREHQCDVCGYRTVRRFDLSRHRNTQQH